MASCSKCEKQDSVPGRKWCLSCLSYMKEARDRHRRLRPPKPPGTCSRTDCTNQADRGLRSCSACREREAEYEKRNKTKIQYEARQKRRRLRMAAFNAYGGPECTCCGEDHYEFLTIDHINGNGAEHRRELGTKGDIYYWLKKNNFPDGFRVLCMNCNFSLGYHGYCPHHGWVQPTSNGRLNRPAASN